MVRLEVIEVAKPDTSAYDALVQYAAVSDAGQRDILERCLVRAFDMVQKYADVALLAGRWRVQADECSGFVRVYMGGEAESVTDAHGLPVPFGQRGSKVYVGANDYVEVVFSTIVNESDYTRLLPVVLKYATAIYDGKDARELNSILKECL